MKDNTAGYKSEEEYNLSDKAGDNDDVSDVNKILISEQSTAITLDIEREKISKDEKSSRPANGDERTALSTYSPD